MLWLFFKFTQADGSRENERIGDQKHCQDWQFYNWKIIEVMVLFTPYPPFFFFKYLPFLFLP